MKIAIIDYGYANIRSVINAFNCFECDISILESPKALADSDKIVMPGVGSFDAGMRGLRERNFIDTMSERVFEFDVPFLGICVGMQMMSEGSEEGDLPGLGWFQGTFRHFPSTDSSLKVPHIGWSEVTAQPDSQLFSGIDLVSDFYFAHSYYLPIDEKKDEICAGKCTYGVPFTAAVEQDHVFGVQFHPEKSQLAGMKIIENFLSI
ncbi:MAG: imidazole glycerol phosphate synthase subunit HisH [Alphaproteobacteria bacterium]|nr:imidazole glycerol phosphate synthase subunit HisH [Alphaproteobacteria bacterium]